MRKLIAASLLIVAFLIAGPCRAEKIILDPNVLGAAAPSPTSEKPDKRLEQKITYNGGYKRLHDVVDHLTKLTGVNIRAGQNAKDWRVRDIPLIVCVKEMPLGKLLRAVADAAHVQLGAERASRADEKPIYRLYRNKKTQDEIAGVIESRAKANLELAEWAWDTLLAYSKMPDAPLWLPAGKGLYPGIEEDIRLISRLLASLGPDAKERIFGGEQISLRTGSAPQSALLRELFTYICTKRGCFDGIPTEPTEQETEDSHVVIRVARVEQADFVPGGFGVFFNGKPLLVGKDQDRTTIDSWSADPVKLAKALSAVEALKISPPPDISGVMVGARLEPPSPDLKPLDADVDADWDLPTLQKEFTLKPREKNERLTRATVLPDLAALADVNIVSEDLESHKDPWTIHLKVDTGKPVTIANALKGLSLDKYHRMGWFVNEDANLIIGWEADWRWRQRNLVPESLLLSIRAKREADGAELDHIAPVLELDPGQYDDWIRSNREFVETLGYMRYEDKMVWQLYCALDAEDKALAKSGSGLPLAKFDTLWISRFCQDRRKVIENRGAVGDNPDVDALRSRKLQLFSDPKLIAGLTMRVKMLPQKGWQVWTRGSDGILEPKFCSPGPKGPKKHSYEIELTGEMDGETITLTAPWDGAYFPILTQEKEIELLKKVQSARSAG